MSDNNEVLQPTENNIKSDELKLETDDKFEFLKTLIETIPNAIFYKDSNFIYRYCNNAFLEFLGLSRKEVIAYMILAPRNLQIFIIKQMLNCLKVNPLKLMKLTLYIRIKKIIMSYLTRLL
jgi:hypothetical protein